MKKTIDETRLTGSRWQRWALAGAFVCLASANPTAWAHSANDSGPDSLKTRVREAALIAYGQVVDIQYRTSVPTRAQPKGVPHTFVTYQIQEVLRGESPATRLTLRIPGGADGQGGAFMETTAPVFALGQTDVLFVKGGAISDCQLVDCVEGRFRVFENQVFNGWGVPVVEAHKALRIGGKPRFDLNIMEMPSPSFKALLTSPEAAATINKISTKTGLSLAELERKYAIEAPKSTIVRVGYQAAPIKKDVTVESNALPAQRFGPPLTLDVFFDAVRMWSNTIGEPTTKVVMADANVKFTVADPKVTAMTAAIPPQPNISEEERLDKLNSGESK